MSRIAEVTKKNMLRNLSVVGLSGDSKVEGEGTGVKDKMISQDSDFIKCFGRKLGQFQI